MTMTSEQFQRVKELFAALEPLSAQERQRALEAASSDDSVVRAQVEKLLERNDEALGGLGMSRNKSTVFPRRSAAARAR